MIKILITVVALALVFVTGFVLTKQDKPEETVVSTSSAVTQTNDSKEVPATNEEVTKNQTTSSDKVLDLSGQGLIKTPASVFDKTSIQELDLSNNKLDGSLQAEVRHLQNLKVLNLSNNLFTGVPAEVGQLKSLEVLDLSNNQLTGLPHELGNLTNLKVLNLKGNAYSSADLSIIKQSLSASVDIQTD
jgi:Leucine-rich repeat (LRR) protein